MEPRLIVIRHSERLDEVDESAWKKLVLRQRAGGGRNSFASDPVISPKQGYQIATEMAVTVKNMVETSPTQGLEVRLYASRLLRAVQTASYIGRALHMPVHVSSGLAQIIPAVKNKQGAFEFASTQELAHYCPSIDIVDCDDLRGLSHLPTNSWRAALDTILARSDSNVLNIVVAHRETVRKLIGEHVQTPYCCLGLFHVPCDGDEKTGHSTDMAESKQHPGEDGDTKCPTGEPLKEDMKMKAPSTKVAVVKAESKPSVRAVAKPDMTAKPIPRGRADSKHPPKIGSASASKAAPKLYAYVDSIEFLAVLDRDGTVVCEKPR